MKLKLADSRKSYRSTKILRSETLEIQPKSNQKKKKKLQKPEPTKDTAKKKANSHDQHKPEPPTRNHH